MTTTIHISLILPDLILHALILIDRRGMTRTPIKLGASTVLDLDNSAIFREVMNDTMALHHTDFLPIFKIALLSLRSYHGVQLHHDTITRRIRPTHEYRLQHITVTITLRRSLLFFLFFNDSLDIRMVLMVISQTEDRLGFTITIYWYLRILDSLLI